MVPDTSQEGTLEDGAVTALTVCISCDSDEDSREEVTWLHSRRGHLAQDLLLATCPGELTCVTSHGANWDCKAESLTPWPPVDITKRLPGASSFLTGTDLPQS